MKKKRDLKRLALWILTAWCTLLTLSSIWIVNKIALLAAVAVKIVEILNELIRASGTWA